MMASLSRQHDRAGIAGRPVIRKHCESSGLRDKDQASYHPGSLEIRCPQSWVPCDGTSKILSLGFWNSLACGNIVVFHRASSLGACGCVSISRSSEDSLVLSD